MTAAPAAFDPKAATIVVVTFNRSHLLTGLLTSITAMDSNRPQTPGRVMSPNPVVVRVATVKYRASR